MNLNHVSQITRISTVKTLYQNNKEVQVKKCLQVKNLLIKISQVRFRKRVVKYIVSCRFKMGWQFLALRRSYLWSRVKNLIGLYGRVFKMFIVRDFIFKYKFLLANHIYHFYFFLQIFYSNHIYELNFRNTSSDNLQIS